MSDSRIRVTFFDYYPLVNGNCSRMPNMHVTKGCPRPGMAVEIIKLLASYLNLTIDIQTMASYPGHKFLFDVIYNNETDMVANFFMNTTKRSLKFDFTRQLYLSYPVIVVKKADRSLKNILSFFNVYKLDTWIGMGCVFVLFTSFALTVRYVECRLKLAKNENFLEILWKMTRFQLVQTDGISYKLVSGRSSLLIFSIFQICIILGLFQGFILSSFVRKTHHAPFTINDNIPQLIKNKRFSIVTAGLTDWYFQDIETSNDSPYYELRDAIKSNNYTMAKDDDEVLEIVNKVLEEGYPTLFNKAKKKCDLVYIKNFFPPAFSRMMFRKGSQFVPLFNKAIKDNKMLIELITLKYLNYDHTSKCATENGGPAPLTMAPYVGLLLVFFVGILLAFFAFSGEILKWQIFSTQRRNSAGTPL